ncbi:hypothetical protein WICPIJ_000643 [Wickerhamomyces pijperi]|uniref:Uncharacterized protein n=1 Tax=Wickerhamomyces pijperi TaxID=599730 RepID=A0A9P8QG02_WICPI|nr:hypothetical protein WICPIJ_000643 [Wickerhamomyces pijperi]
MILKSGMSDSGFKEPIKAINGYFASSVISQTNSSSLAPQETTKLSLMNLTFCKPEVCFLIVQWVKVFPVCKSKEVNFKVVSSAPVIINLVVTSDSPSRIVRSRISRPCVPSDK